MSALTAEASPISIMLVEDNEDDRLRIEDLLQSSVEHYAVNAFNAGNAALDYFDANVTSCIILDYRLGPDDGIRLLAEFKKRDPFVPIIILTGQGSEELASTAIKSGASDYLVKKMLSESLLRSTINSAIKQAELERKIDLQAQEQRVFLEVLVHDLKAPLRNIQDFSRVAIEEQAVGNTDELKECLEMQKNTADRAFELISTLETYALLDAEVEFTSVNLTEVANAATDNLRVVIADQQAEVTIEDLPSLMGDAPQLTQLLQNLIQNGLKYNHSANPKVTVKGSALDTHTVSITIHDNGIGMSEENLKAIFKPFKRLWSHDQYEGTGLGLATCSKVVQRHRGKIWCTSEVGIGSQFHVSFPNTQDRV